MSIRKLAALAATLGAAAALLASAGVVFAHARPVRFDPAPPARLSRPHRRKCRAGSRPTCAGTPTGNLHSHYGCAGGQSRLRRGAIEHQPARATVPLKSASLPGATSSPGAPTTKPMGHLRRLLRVLRGPGSRGPAQSPTTSGSTAVGCERIDQEGAPASAPGARAAAATAADVHEEEPRRARRRWSARPDRGLDLALPGTRRRARRWTRPREELALDADAGGRTGLSGSAGAATRGPGGDARGRGSARAPGPCRPAGELAASRRACDHVAVFSEPLERKVSTVRVLSLRSASIPASSSTMRTTPSCAWA